MPRKRSAAASNSASKRTKLDSVVTAGHKLLARYESYDFSGEGSETLTALECQDLVRYAVHLRNLVDDQRRPKDNFAMKGDKELSEKEIREESERLSDKIGRGIAKQLTWQEPCRYGAATFSFDGKCPVLAVMAYLLDLEHRQEVRNFIHKKFTLEEFEDIIGWEVTGSAGHDRLVLVGPTVSLRWKPGTREFNWTGKYGTHDGKKLAEDAAAEAIALEEAAAEEAAVEEAATKEAAPKEATSSGV